MAFQPGAVIYTQGFGSRPEGVEVPVIQTREPTAQDINYDLGTRWINTVGNTAKTLTSFSSFNGVITATWV